MVTGFLVGILVILLLLLLPTKPKHFPPGPLHFPLLGGFLSIILGGFPRQLDQRAQKFAKLYGNISGLLIGPLSVVSIAGTSEVKEALNCDSFNQRPSYALNKLIKNRKQMLGISMANGDFWKEQRRFTHRHLKNLGFGKTSMEGIILQETDAAVEAIREAAGTDWNTPVSMENIIKTANLNVLWHIMSGQRYDYKNPRLWRLLNLVEVWNSVFTNRPVSAYFMPFFSKFTSKRISFQDIKKEIQEFVMETIVKHKEDLDPENPKDFIDVYLMEVEKCEQDENSSFSIKQLRGICFDLFIAGLHTTSGTLGFCLLYLILKPDIQTRIQEDLDRVLGDKKYPSFKDKSSLPYLEATINEGLRLRPVVPTVPRCPSTSNSSVNFRGYSIPQGSTVGVQILSAHMDESVWKDPEDFCPERFLDENGQLKKMDAFMPFGAGKRSCIGESLARNNLFLLLGGILKNYRLHIPEGEKPPSTVPCGGITVSPQPYKMRVEPRNHAQKTT